MIKVIQDRGTRSARIMLLIFQWKYVNGHNPLRKYQYEKEFAVMGGINHRCYVCKQ